MIELPKRSVTRFFIPLIDVLILQFCIFLLMPLVRATGEGEDQGDKDAPLSERDRLDLERLRQQRQAWQDLDSLKKEKSEMQQLVQQLQKDKLDALQQRLAIRVLEISEDGTLYAYDARNDGDRRVEITQQNVKELVEQQKRTAEGKEVYFLILYPRPAQGLPVFPLRSQREEYDRWFAGVAHGYDIPLKTR